MSGTILIVDAVATNRLSLRMRLNKARYTVQAVHSIQEALLSQQAGSWDAVILSVETPKDIFSLSALVEKSFCTSACADPKRVSGFSDAGAQGRGRGCFIKKWQHRLSFGTSAVPHPDAPYEA